MEAGELFLGAVLSKAPHAAHEALLTLLPLPVQSRGKTRYRNHPGKPPGTRINSDVGNGMPRNPVPNPGDQPYLSSPQNASPPSATTASKSGLMDVHIQWLTDNQRASGQPANWRTNFGSPRRPALGQTTVETTAPFLSKAAQGDTKPQPAQLDGPSTSSDIKRLF
ncbi:hypothetical protein PCANC_25583 [Puccinia coronata f. sp. avenae]|uniref:Uncharacterized protein n=1 Tax=Puccinia coronata f. sp. avenae TaxID=200324 RepID=A0A2N5TM94_9BASI|nr:hypothetical protein PCANC_25583 [Puccinia coronata f. sp. avenae]